MAGTATRSASKPGMLIPTTPRLPQADVWPDAQWRQAKHG
jgi:hypothetical protein